MSELAELRDALDAAQYDERDPRLQPGAFMVDWAGHFHDIPVADEYWQALRASQPRPPPLTLTVAMKFKRHTWQMYREARRIYDSGGPVHAVISALADYCFACECERDARAAWRAAQVEQDHKNRETLKRQRAERRERRRKIRRAVKNYLSNRLPNTKRVAR